MICFLEHMIIKISYFIIFGVHKEKILDVSIYNNIKVYLCNVKT